MTEHTVVPEVTVLRIVFECAGIVVDSLAELLLSDTCQSTQLVDVHHIRIALECLRTIALCSCEVIEVEFRDATEEPRLVEIRL